MPASSSVTTPPRPRTTATGTPDTLPLTSSAAQASSFRLVYRSRNLLAAERHDAELGAIFLSSRSNNREQDITGALLVSGQYFVQTLEGAEDAVRALYDRIEKDSRHDEVTLLQTGTAGERVFGRWAMARVDDGSDADIPLLADKKRGVTRAADRRPTPEQEVALADMRAAAQG